MKRVSILVLHGTSPIGVYGPYEIFHVFNELSVKEGGEKLFEINVVGVEESVIHNSTGIPISFNHTINDAIESDLIIIPSVGTDVDKALLENKPVISWLKNEHKKGVEIASICTGSFLLALTGLLNEKSATTHWAFESMFKTLFPQINLQSHELIIDENKIITCGGAFTYTDLLLYIVERYFGRDLANKGAKFMVINRSSSNNQMKFTIFNGQKDHGDDKILEIQNYIEKNFKHIIDVKGLAETFAFTTKTLTRRFSAATKNTPLKYILRVKIEQAKRILETDRTISIEEVAWSVGYDNISGFRKVFKKYTGESPSHYRENH